MDCIKHNRDLGERRWLAGLWALYYLNRKFTAEELDQAIDDPSTLARSLQADPVQICDFWSIMVCHAFLQETIVDGSIINFRRAEVNYPNDLDIFDPNPGQKVTGVILKLWPKIMGHEVTLCIFEGMKPKSGLMALDGDAGVSALLAQISDTAMARILWKIREGSGQFGSLWLRAICETEPMSTEMEEAVYGSHHNPKDASELIKMIRSCQANIWTTDPVSPSYVKAKLDQLKKYD